MQNLIRLFPETFEQANVHEINDVQTQFSTRNHQLTEDAREQISMTLMYNCTLPHPSRRGQKRFYQTLTHSLLRLFPETFERSKVYEFDDAQTKFSTWGLQQLRMQESKY